MEQDNYIDHPMHDVYDPKCSSCWTEVMVIKASKNRMPFGQNPDSLFSEGEHSKYLGRRRLPSDRDE